MILTDSDLAKSKVVTLVGEMSEKEREYNKLEPLLNMVFGKKRLIIIKRDSNKRELKKVLELYCKNKSIQYIEAPKSFLSVDVIKNRTKIIEDEFGIRHKTKSLYDKDINQMIVVEGLGSYVDREVLRAFWDMAYIPFGIDDIANCTTEKLAYGSGYIFIAGENFPMWGFGSLSWNWHEEVRIIDMRDFEI